MGSILMLFIIFVVIVIVIGFKSAKTSENRDKNIGAINDFSVGKYIGGLPDSDDPVTDVECVITETNFVFFSHISKELGKIPRNNINQIILDDKTKIAQRLTVTRMLTLGIFSLAAPKKKSYIEFCILIDWTDNRGVRYNTIFEFTGDDANKNASKAANQLNKYIQVSQSCDDEKICPYCAETIKKAAKICRFCNRDIVRAENV